MSPDNAVVLRELKDPGDESGDVTTVLASVRGLLDFRKSPPRVWEDIVAHSGGERLVVVKK